MIRWDDPEEAAKALNESRITLCATCGQKIEGVFSIRLSECPPKFRHPECDRPTEISDVPPT